MGSRASELAVEASPQFLATGIFNVAKACSFMYCIHFYQSAVMFSLTQFEFPSLLRQQFLP